MARWVVLVEVLKDASREKGGKDGKRGLHTDDGS